MLHLTPVSLLKSRMYLSLYLFQDIRFFLSSLLMCMLCIIQLKCTLWWVLTNVNTYTTTTRIKIQNIPITQRCSPVIISSQLPTSTPNPKQPLIFSLSFLELSLNEIMQYVFFFYAWLFIPSIWRELWYQEFVPFTTMYCSIV